MKRFVSISIGLTGCLLGAVASASPYDYVATTEAAGARQQGAVTISSGIVWQCRGHRCSIRGPWAAPSVAACAQLAALVGPLRSYGHTGAQLTTSQMRECNAQAARVQTASKPVAQAGPSVPKPIPTTRVPGAPLPPLPGTASKGVAVGTAKAPAPQALDPNTMVAYTATEPKLQGLVRLQPIMDVQWRCTGDRCEAQADQFAREVTADEACHALATRVGRIKAFYWRGPPVNSEEVRVCNIEIKSVELNATSGGDDFRRNSELRVEFLPRGEQVAKGSFIEFESGIPANRNARAVMIFTPSSYPQLRNSRYLLNKGIGVVRFIFQSGKTGGLDSPDDWDSKEMIANVTVEAVDGATRTTFLFRHHSPHRFSHGTMLDVPVRADLDLKSLVR